MGCGTYHMASGSSYDIPTSNIDKPVNQKNFMASLAACNLQSEVARGGDSTRFPTSKANIIRSAMLSLNL